jgi:hypothetical protein
MESFYDVFPWGKYGNGMLQVRMIVVALCVLSMMLCSCGGTGYLEQRDGLCRHQMDKVCRGIASRCSLPAHPQELKNFPRTLTMYDAVSILSAARALPLIYYVGVS